VFLICEMNLLENNINYILGIVLKSGSARRVDPGLEPGQVDEKIEKVMTRRVDPVTRLTRQNPVATRWLFFIKTTPFWIFFKYGLTRSTRSKPGTQVLDRAGFKNYDFRILSNSLTYWVKLIFWHVITWG